MVSLRRVGPEKEGEHMNILITYCGE